MNISEAMNFSLISWLNKESLKKALSILVCYIIFYALLIGIVLYFFGELFTSLVSNKLDSYLLKLFQPAYMSNFLGQMLFFIILVILLAIIFSLVIDYFYFSILKYALSKRNIKSQELSSKLFIRLVLLQILTVLAMLFYPQDKKLLAIQWISLVLVLLAAIRMSIFPIMAIFLIFIVPYGLLVIHNGLRYSQSLISMLVDNSSFSASLKKSWDLTCGRFWDIFVTNLAVLIAMALVIAGISFVLTLVLSAISSLIVQNTLVQHIISDAISNILFSPVSYFVQAFLLAFIYSDLINAKQICSCGSEEKKPEEKPVEPKKPLPKPSTKNSISNSKTIKSKS